MILGGHAAEFAAITMPKVRLEAGSSRYCEIKQSETNAAAGGRPVAGSIPNLFMFYELDPGNGAAAVSRLKPAR